MCRTVGTTVIERMAPEMDGQEGHLLRKHWQDRLTNTRVRLFPLDVIPRTSLRRAKLPQASWGQKQASCGWKTEGSLGPTLALPRQGTGATAQMQTGLCL